MDRKCRAALFLAINSGVALVFTVATMFWLTQMPLGLPAKVVEKIGPQIFRIIWPLLAIELILCAFGVFRFRRARRPFGHAR